MYLGLRRSLGLGRGVVELGHILVVAFARGRRDFRHAARALCWRCRRVEKIVVSLRLHIRVGFRRRDRVSGLRQRVLGALHCCGSRGLVSSQLTEARTDAVRGDAPIRVPLLQHRHEPLDPQHRMVNFVQSDEQLIVARAVLGHRGPAKEAPVRAQRVCAAIADHRRRQRGRAKAWPSRPGY